MQTAPDRRTAGLELAGPRLEVRAVTDPALLANLTAGMPDHFHDFLQLAGPAASEIDLVTPGRVLARYAMPGGPTASGEWVDGGPLGAADVTGLAGVAGAGTEFDTRDLRVTARAAGVPVFDGSQFRVIPLECDGRVEVAIAADSQSAAATLTPPGPGGRPVSAAYVAHVLATSGVRLGADQQRIEELVAALHATGGRVTGSVAFGRQPQRGADGSIEYLVDLGSLPLTAADQDDRIDFKRLNIICSVTRHQPLVRRHPATRGTQGFTVTGRILPATDGREAPLPLGANVQIDPDDPNVLRSAIDGNLRVIHGKMEVNKSFTVPNDVDYSTGHIRYDHSVVIRGDVKGGFNVECGGDLEVLGAVEDCHVRAGGDVLVRGGFMGQGTGIVRAGGAVRLGFGRNQTVHCSGPLLIEREAINMSLRSGDSVTVAGLLVGGEIIARRHVECRVCGNQGGAKTKIEVGVVFELLQAAVGLGREIDAMRRRRRPEEEIAILEAQRKSLLEQAYRVDAATVVVKERINPGVTLKIGAAPLISITEETRGPLIFTLRDGEVQIA